MTVLQAMSVGWSERRARSIATAIASASWPSIHTVLQPDGLEAR